MAYFTILKSPHTISLIMIILSNILTGYTLEMLFFHVSSKSSERTDSHATHVFNVLDKIKHDQFR